MDVPQSLEDVTKSSIKFDKGDLILLFHPKLLMNHEAEQKGLLYKSVCRLDIHHETTLETLFKDCQNENERYAAIEERSTSVGDIFYDVKRQSYYIVKGVGFEKIKPELLLIY